MLKMHTMKQLIKRAKQVAEFVRQSREISQPHMAYMGGWLGFDNLGDEAIFNAAEVLFPQCGMIPYSGRDGFEIALAAKLLKVFQYSLMGGGTLINRLPATLQRAKKSLPLAKHSIIFGSGVASPVFWTGREDWQDARKQWVPVLEKCDYVGVRGPLSVELLKDVGFTDVEIVGDPVLALAGEVLPNENDIQEKTIGLNIGVALGSFGSAQMWGDADYVFQQYVQLAKTATQAGWKVHWFVVWKNDLEIALEAAKQSGTEGNIHQEYYDYNKYFDVVRKMSVFVGMKLHAVALAMCAYVPSVMLEYRPKCRDFMMSLDQQDNNIRTDEFKAHDVWERVKAWDANRPRISASLYDAIQPVATRQKQRALDVFNAMESK